MARDFDGSADYAANTSIGNVTSGTIAGRVNPNSFPASTARDVAFTFHQGGESEEFFNHDKQIFWRSTGIVGCRVWDSPAKLAISTSSLSTGTWSHIGISFSGADELRMWFDGVNEATTAINGTGSYGSPNIGFCRRPLDLNDGESSRDRADALFAEWAIWDETLDADDFGALAAGVSPIMVRPSAIVSYWPFYGLDTTEPDLFGGHDLTLTSAPPKAAHPPLILPAGPRIVVPSPAIAGPTTFPAAMATGL